MDEEDQYVLRSGHLNVGDGHEIYWEEWGNPDGYPIMHFHGGPGGGFNDSHKLLFDPARHRVVFFDQRGSGRSTPFASIEHNTTQDLIADTEKLRKHLKIEKTHVVGGSWGSTMTMLYAIAYPDRVKHMVMWGIYLARQFETDYVSEGYPRHNYPEAWERFIALVPEEHRTNGTAITKYYADKMASSDNKKAQRYADEWSLWELSLMSLKYDKRKLEQEVIGDETNIPLAKLETHYFLNNCFIPENYILDNIKNIQRVPCYVVQGRFDNCTPPVSAYELSKAYGKNLTLQWASAGHKRTDPELLAALQAAINTTLV